MRNNLFFIALTLLATPIAYGMYLQSDSNDEQMEKIKEKLNRHNAIWVEDHKKGEPFPSTKAAKLRNLLHSCSPCCVISSAKVPYRTFNFRTFVAAEKCTKERKLSLQELRLLLKMKTYTEETLQQRYEDGEIPKTESGTPLEEAVTLALNEEEYETARQMPLEFAEFYELHPEGQMLVSRVK